MTDDELAHFGVLGMKWGRTRAKATGSEIHAARRKIDALRSAHNVAVDQRRGTKKGTAAYTKANAKVQRIEKDFKNDPKRVIAARMTRGEKAAAIFLAAPTGGVSLLAIGVSSAASRRIEKKQEDKAYDKK